MHSVAVKEISGDLLAIKSHGHFALLKTSTSLLLLALLRKGRKEEKEKNTVVQIAEMDTDKKSPKCNAEKEREGDVCTLLSSLSFLLCIWLLFAAKKGKEMDTRITHICAFMAFTAEGRKKEEMGTKQRRGKKDADDNREYNNHVISFLFLSLLCYGRACMKEAGWRIFSL